MVYCSVIIPTLSRADLLSDTLDALALQTERDFEAIVICDGEDERTRALSAHFSADYPIDWVFNPRNLGPSSARNIGAERAHGEVLLFLDDDCLPVADWLLHHCEHHRRHNSDREIVILGHLDEIYLHLPSSNMERMLRNARKQNLADVYARCMRMNRDRSRYPECGINSSIRRDAFWAAGGFDTALRFAEDPEFGTRLAARGVRMIYEPQAIVCHRNSKNLIDYHVKTAELCAQTDVYRVREKRQRTNQTQRLLALHKGRVLRKLKERLAWQYPNALRGVGEICQKVTDLTGCRSSFQLWNSLVCAAAYWDGVKSEGMTLTSLRELIGSPLPVLMFNSIFSRAGREERRYRLCPSRFRRFVRWLRHANYNSTCPAEWLSAPIGPRRVMLTFDHGCEEFYWEGFPVLQQYGFSATLFVVVDRIGATNLWDDQEVYRRRRMLSLQQLRELPRHGLTIGSHSLTHQWLPDLSDDELCREVADSKVRLENVLGEEVTCFAYPYGGVDERVRAAVARAGYKIAMTTEQGLSFWDDPLAIRRIALSEADSLTDFILKLMIGRSVRLDALAQLEEALQAFISALPAPARRMIQQRVHWIRRRQ
jgi:peptidoglycan/xylan/chitin deacetylase (PgdA/CDA1 family)/GT2 family glycosyltransferase